jgi:hypothetical protein
MSQKLSQDISQKSARISLFIFFSLLSLSVTFFVFAADDVVTEQNIFQDSDQDGLSNDEEMLYKTDLLNKDTDGDGYMDGVEVESGYDPLKPAPGDRLLSGEDARESSDDPVATDRVTLTDQVTNEVANLIEQQVSGDGVELSAENIETSVQNIMSQSQQEIVLPEVDLETIKIKEVSDKLKGTRRAEQEKEDAVEYLTVMAYILANNSPKKFSTENDLSSVLSSFGQDSITAIVLGNGSFVDDLSKTGQKILDETKDIEVPENMLSVHAQALKMAKYSMQLKDEVKSDDSGDPLGKIASLAKVDGFLGVVVDLSQEIYGTLSDLGIQEIPIDL